MEELLKQIQQRYNEKLDEMSQVETEKSKLKEELFTANQQISNLEASLSQYEKRLNKMKEAFKGLDDDQN